MSVRDCAGPGIAVDASARGISEDRFTIWTLNPKPLNPKIKFLPSKADRRDGGWTSAQSPGPLSQILTPGSPKP